MSSRARIDELAVAEDKHNVEVRIAPAFKLRSEPAEHVGIHALGISGLTTQPSSWSGVFAIVSIGCLRDWARQVAGFGKQHKQNS
jgi:hypothetical protein